MKNDSIPNIGDQVLQEGGKCLYNRSMNITNSQEHFFAQLPPDDQIPSLFDLIPEVSFVLKDRNYRYIMLNRSGCEYCGISHYKDAIGKTDHDFFPSEKADAYRNDDREVIKKGVSIMNRIESAPVQDGSKRMVITDKIPLRNAQGDVIGLVSLSRHIEHVSEESGSITKFSEMLAYMRANYGEPIVTKQLAGIAGMSISQFERRFRKAFGTSPRQYLLGLRVNAAARALVQTDDTVAAIAQDCGFHDHAHLCRTFRAIMNKTPSNYRREKTA